MADPDQQLQAELLNSVARAIGTRRPVLTHLNADTTWLVQLPWPASQNPPADRHYFNILIDPWLSGPQSDVASWFSTQWHAVPPSVGSIAELEQRLEDIEELAQQIEGRREGSLGRQKRSGQAKSASFIDAVAVCHEFTDHCHQATLLEISPSVPVIATEKAADLIRSWKHFDTVYTTPSFSPSNPDWRQTSVECLPDWIGISRVTTAGNALYYHSALLITFSLSLSDAAEAIIYSPHGIQASDLTHIPAARPPIRTLALLHGLHDIALTKNFQLNLGAHNGLKAQRITRPRYWCASHDEMKTGGGIVSYFLRREVLSVKDALMQEAAATEDDDSGEDEEAESEKRKMRKDLEDVNFADLQSGESLLLE